jgi:hypothetical protein
MPVERLIAQYEAGGGSLRQLASRMADIAGEPDKVEKWRRYVQGYKRGRKPHGDNVRVVALALDADPIDVIDNHVPTGIADIEDSVERAVTRAVGEPLSNLADRLAGVEQRLDRLERSRPAAPAGLDAPRSPPAGGQG